MLDHLALAKFSARLGMVGTTEYCMVYLVAAWWSPVHLIICATSGRSLSVSLSLSLVDQLSLSPLHTQSFP